MKFFHSMTFRIIMLSITGVLLTVIALIVSVVLSQSKTEHIVSSNRVQIEGQNIENMKPVAWGVYNSVQIYDEVLLSKLGDGLLNMREKFRASGNLEKLSAAMNYDPKTPSPIVDDVSKVNDVHATIFRKMGDGSMVRVSTSIIRDGKRFVNTKITPTNADGTPNAVLQSVLNGKKYVGRANVGGEWVNAMYDPIIEKGQVVGMLFVGSLAKDTKKLIDAIRKLKYGKDGSVFAIGGKGAQKGVLTISIDGKSDYQNVWESTNSKGEYFWRNIAEKGSSLPENSAEYMEVDYKDNSGEYKLAIVEMYYAPWDWVIGVSIPKEEIEKSSVEMQNSLEKAMEILKEQVYITGIIMVVLVLIASFIFSKNLTKNINQAIIIFNKIAKGDMTHRLEVTKDDIGEMAGHFNKLMDSLHGFMKEVMHDTSSLNIASEDLFSVSKNVAASAEDSMSQSSGAASATEQVSASINSMASHAEEASLSAEEVANAVGQVSANINSMANAAKEASASASEVAGAAEQMSSNMNTIAAAIEEMSASISQISSNADSARRVAGDATDKSREATEAMSKLGVAAKEIGQVTNVIKKIADKTNLLALNANIEAASAGEAGKSFAVVANEIKELANQSASSADDIARRIEGIQKSTSDAVTAIKNVSGIIVQVNESVESISNHAAQQTKASNEIANSVAMANTGAKRVAGSVSEVAKNSKNIASNASQANAGIDRVSKSINEVAKGSKDIAYNAGEAARGANMVSRNMVNIAQGSKDGAQGAKQINQSADGLAKIAVELTKVLNQFRV